MTINFTSNHRKTAQVTNPQQNSNLVQAQKLYGQFVNGERPEYQHDINQDPNMQQLNTLAERYKQSLSIEDKKALLNHETKILYEELEHPELTLARNYSEIEPLIDTTKTKSDVKNILTGFNLAGIDRRERNFKPFETKKSPEKIDLFNKISNYIDENSMFGPEIKIKINTIILSLKNGMYSNVNDNQNHSQLINDLKNDSNKTDSLTYLLQNAQKDEYPETTEIVNTILKDKKVKPEIKQLAVWGAGKFKSEEGFKAVKEIALNTKEKDVRLREFAIHSTALYLRQKPDEVRNIMSQIEKDGSIFAPLGRILNDKVNGNYHGQKDREFKYANVEDEEKRFIKTISNEMVKNDTPINIHKQNQLDRDLLLHKNSLLDFYSNEQKILISKDTVTKYFPSCAGKRDFAAFRLSPESGYFEDIIEGCNGENTTILNINRIGNKFEHGVIAHEFGHARNLFFNKEEHMNQIELYYSARNKKHFLDDYSESNESEYYANGCEAMASVYKPHNSLISSNPVIKGYSNTRYELMAEHPNLYKFVKETLKIARR